MITLHNGQQNQVQGWYVDLHGHQLFMRRGDLAPLCPHSLPTPALWRLVREVAEVRTDLPQ